MPTEVFDDGLDLTIELLEALPPTADSLPYPALRLLGRSESRTFRAIILENAFLRVTILPELGGRIIGIFDKRTGTDALPVPTRLTPVEGGSRGVRLTAGIEIVTGPEERLNALGLMDVMPDEAEDETGDAGCWLAEVAAGGLGLHVHVSLPADRAVIEIEVRVHNRTLHSINYFGGLMLPSDGSWVREADGYRVYDESNQRGLFVGSEALRLVESPHGTTLRRFSRPQPIAPHQLDTWRATLVPITGLPEVSVAGSAGAIHLGTDSVSVQATERRTGHKLLLLTADGQTLEAPVDLHPENTVSIPLDGLPSRAVAAALRNERREDVLNTATELPSLDTTESIPALASLEPGAFEPILRAATFDVATRHLAHLLLGYRRLAGGEYAKADESFEQSLLYNGDDSLAWWGKAAARRLQGDSTDEERPELLNAHYLAPLDPLLRAEAFLAQSSEQGREKNPLLNSLEGMPENFIEVAARLLEAGLFADATRWIDEAIRHIDLPMLRYLQAYAYLSASRMDVEAAEQVAAAGRLAIAPPYPWRQIEIDALAALSKRFPADAGVGRWHEISLLAVRA